MFTETTIILLGLFVACEICTLIVFCYQRTVRKLSLRLKLPQSSLNICYPSWMLAMYWAAFSKYAIALALLIIDWRCALVAAGMFVLFFLISACISVPDGTNLIRIYKEVKKRGSGALRTGVYQALISEIEKGIVATGGDLAKLNKMENEDLEWTSKTHMTHGHMWHASDNNSSQTNGGYSCFTQGNESDLMNDLSVKRHKEILESKDIRKYLELYEEAPTPVKISVVIWGLWVIVGLVLGFVFEESIQSNIGTAFVNVLFIAAILRGSRWVRNFYAIGVLIFAILVGVNAISSDSFVDDVMSTSIILNCLIAVVYICPLFTKSAHSWFYCNRQDPSKNKWIIALLAFVIAILLLLIVAAFNDCEDGGKATGMHKINFMSGHRQMVGTQPMYNHNDDSTLSQPSENMLQKATRPQTRATNSSRMSDKKLNALVANADRRPMPAPVGTEDFSQYSDEELQRIIDSGGKWRRPVARPVAATHRAEDLSQLTDEELDARIAALESKQQGAYASQAQSGSIVFDDESNTDSRRMTLEKRIATVRQAAEHGDLDAQTALGYFYSYGIGVVKDVREAVKWYRMAAEQGYAEAQTALGGCYVLGKGVEKDGVEALKWYRKAAGQGHADAQYYLGSFYALGAVVEQDLKEAAKWYRRAANQGHAEAAEALRAIDIQ